MTDLMVNYGAGLGGLLSFMLCLIPEFILYTMPFACLTAVLLSFIRMASDNEIIALHSSGVSLYQLMPPVVIFSLTCFLFTGLLTLYWAPYGNRTLEYVKINLAKSSFESQIKEGFNLEFDDLVFFIGSYSLKDKIMKDVFVVDKSEEIEKTIVAKKAIYKPLGNKISIQLIDPKVFSESEGGALRIAESSFYEAYTIEIDSILESSGSEEIKPRGMYLKELLELINNSKESIKIKNNAKIKLYEMFSLPLAVFIIGVAGAPLGAHIRANGRTKGIIVSFLLFLGYFITLKSIRYICENGMINPAIGVWLPVLFLLIVSVLLLVRSAGNLSLGFFNRFTLFNTSQ